MKRRLLAGGLTGAAGLLAAVLVLALNRRNWCYVNVKKGEMQECQTTN